MEVSPYQLLSTDLVVHHPSIVFLLDNVLHFREKLDIKNKQSFSFQAYDGASVVYPGISLLLAALP